MSFIIIILFIFSTSGGVGFSLATKTIVLDYAMCVEANSYPIFKTIRNIGGEFEKLIPKPEEPSIDQDEKKRKRKQKIVGNDQKNEKKINICEQLKDQVEKLKSLLVHYGSITDPKNSQKFGGLLMQKLNENIGQNQVQCVRDVSFIRALFRLASVLEKQKAANEKDQEKRKKIEGQSKWYDSLINMVDTNLIIPPGDVLIKVDFILTN